MPSDRVVLLPHVESGVSYKLELCVVFTFLCFVCSGARPCFLFEGGFLGTFTSPAALTPAPKPSALWPKDM